jgi:hypothetical protein
VDGPPWPGAVRVQALSATDELAALSKDVMGAVVLVPWETGGTSGRRRQVGGVWRAADVVEGEARAWRMWVVAGGTRAMAEEERRLGRVRDARKIADLAAFHGGRPSQEAIAGMMGWLGEVLPGNGRRARPLPQVQRRRLGDSLVLAGLQGGGRGRWVVAEVLAWRGRSKTSQEALIRWAGFDVRTGMPWPDEWRPRSHLTADLQALGACHLPPRAVPKATRPPPERREEAAGRRKSPRLAGTEPMAGMR